MTDSTKSVPNSMLSNTTYDRLKFFALVLLPALGALYFGLGQIWGFPKAEEIVGSITVIDAFLGILLRESNKNYKKSDARFDGTIDKTHDEGTTVFSLNLEGDPVEVLEQKDEVLFKVQDAPVEVALEMEEKPKPRKRAPRKKV